MELQKLVNVFSEILGKESNDVITADTAFKDCERWDSMSAFEISERIYTDFGVKLRGIQIRKCNTIKDLFDLINNG